MRLFFIGWSSEEVGFTEVVKQLRKGGHEIVYWTTSNLNVKNNSKDFPETIFQDYSDALAGKPAQGIDSEKFPPPGRDLIQQFHDTESIAISMMSKRYENLPTEERKHLYYHLLQYWQGVINQYNPEAIIFSAAPHTVYDYVIYALAKKKNIKTILFECSVVNDRMLLLEDFRESHPLLKLESWKNQSGEFKLSDLSEDLREYYLKQSKLRNSREIPDFQEATYKLVNVLLRGRYSNTRIFKARMQSIWRSIRNLSFPKLIIKFFINRLGPNLKKEYQSVQLTADFKKKFIYVPLHYQPEQSTVTQGDVFVDQLLMIEILSYALPKDWLIYVKEHPYQWRTRGLTFFYARPRGYYKAIARLKNVRIVPYETNTFELINYAKTVATVAGAAAWEMVIRLKPALLFGHVWFQNSPGVFRVDNVDSCRKALAEIESGFSFNENDLIKFLTAFDKASFRGYVDPEGGEASGLKIEENINNFLQAISGFLRKSSPEF